MKRKLTIFIYFVLHLEIRHLQLTRRWHVGDRFFFFWTAQVKSPLIECAHCSRLHLNGDFCRGDTWPGICLTVMPGLAMLSVCVPESSSRFPPVDCFWLTRLTRARTNTRALTHTQPKTITDLPVPHYTISAYDQSGWMAAAALMSLWYDPPRCSCSQLYFGEAAVGP